MNFLAHLWIAECTGTSPAGAILGDLVRGRDLSAFPPAIAEGIRLHRQVDARFDADARIRALREGYPAGARRYAGIVIDLAGDYALACDWSQHSAASLADFCDRSAHAVAAEARWFTQAGAPPPEPVSFARLLQSYATEAGIEQALRRVALRLRQGERLLAAGAQWRQTAAQLRPQLGALLSDLCAGVDRAALRRPGC